MNKASLLVIGLAICTFVSNIAAQSSNTAAATTVRPYQFGFTIEEQQHRFEKRDERGIVMGEFGFITADGIYHVTVYATDEEGKFRILAMKNYPYKDRPSVAKTALDVVVPISTTTAATTTTTNVPKPVDLVRKFYNAEACSGCSLLNGNGKKNGAAPDIDLRTAPTTENPSNGQQRPTTNTQQGNSPGSATGPLSKPYTPTNGNGIKPGNGQGSGNANGNNKSRQNSVDLLPAIMNSIVPLVSNTANTQTSSDSSKGSSAAGQTPSSANGKQTGNGLVGGIGNKGGIGGIGSDGANGGAGKTGDSKNIGTAGDLYRFKYVLDYNGHQETGSRNGDKEGSYFVIGENNVEQNIEYVANEFGYQPRVHYRKLDAADEAKRPQENTLKEYEFVWFNKKE